MRPRRVLKNGKMAIEATMEQAMTGQTQAGTSVDAVSDVDCIEAKHGVDCSASQSNTSGTVMEFALMYSRFAEFIISPLQGFPGVYGVG